jgi:NADPH2:quinone reductase
MEASGIVLEVGEGVRHLKIGDRVAYASNPLGAYTEARTMPATLVCKLPEEISFEEGAAMMLKGLTVQYLFHKTTPLSAGDKVLFHAAAGGVGLIACQWAKSEGIELIGTAGTDKKCKMAIEYGATHAINYKTDDFTKKCLELTNGKGVPVVMDAVGKDTFEGSLNCLEPLGMMISFGNTSGKVPPVDIGLLQTKGSLKLTRPTLFNPHLASHESCQDIAEALFKKVLSKDVKIPIGQTFKFEDIAEAHIALEASKTVGSTVITLE